MCALTWKSAVDITRKSMKISSILDSIAFIFIPDERQYLLYIIWCYYEHSNHQDVLDLNGFFQSSKHSYRTFRYEITHIVQYPFTYHKHKPFALRALLYVICSLSFCLLKTPHETNQQVASHWKSRWANIWCLGTC